MLANIKSPLKFLGRDIRSNVRHYWNVFKLVQMAAKSSFQSVILPAWKRFRRIYTAIKNKFRREMKTKKVNETTPLLEDVREIESDGESVCSEPVVRSGVPVKPIDFRTTSLSTNKTEAPRIMYYYVDQYCALCRRGVTWGASDYKDPQSGEADLPPGDALPWDTIMLAICPAYIGTSKRYFAVKLDCTQRRETAFFPIGLQQIPLVMADVKYKPFRDTKGSKLGDPDRNYRQEAFAVHRFCRNMAASLFKNRSVHQMICQFGQSTRYLARTDQKDRYWVGSLRSLAPYFASLDGDWRLASLLLRLSLLPVEIEDEIRDDISHDVLSVVINFMRTTVPLINAMSDRCTTTNLVFDPTLPYMTAYNTSIYEAVMLQKLVLTAEAKEEIEEEWCLFASSALTTGVQGIEINLGDHGTGIRAFRFLYEDGTKSQYIGSPFPESEKRTNTTILGRNVKGLRIITDHLKISKIDLIADRTWFVEQRDYKRGEESPLSLRKRSYMLPKIQSQSPSTLTFPQWRAEDQRSNQKRNFNNWQAGNFCTVVRELESDYCTSLTVYCLPNSVCGIAFHDPGSEGQPRLLGYRNPAAVSLHCDIGPSLRNRWKHVMIDLDAAERAGSWGENRCPPFIVTSRHSPVLNCTSLMGHTDLSRKPRFAMLKGLEPCHLTGLFTDGTTNPDGSIRNLGITYHVISPPPPPPPGQEPENWPKEEPIELPVPDCGGFPQHWNGGFITTASLFGVAKISIRRRGDRVMGLKIEYLLVKTRDPSSFFQHTAILGQFDPSFPSEISTIYTHGKDGELLSFQFGFAHKKKIGWGDADSDYVTRIAVNVSCRCESPSPYHDSGSEGRSFRWRYDQGSKSIAWLFNSTNDQIQHWNGTRTEIETVEVQPKELLLNPGISLPERDIDEGFVLWDEHEYEGEDGESADDGGW